MFHFFFKNYYWLRVFSVNLLYRALVAQTKVTNCTRLLRTRTWTSSKSLIHIPNDVPPKFVSNRCPCAMHQSMSSTSQYGFEVISSANSLPTTTKNSSLRVVPDANLWIPSRIQSSPFKRLHPTLSQKRNAWAKIKSLELNLLSPSLKPSAVGLSRWNHPE